MSVTPRFQSPYGAFDLTRYPARVDETLHAWSSADTLALEEVHRRGIPGSRVLVVNDAHGSLCVALQPQALWTDSALAVLALRRNERANSRIETPVFWSTQIPNSTPDMAVLRIPKQRAYFEYQLSQLARWLPEGATVLAAGMDKHLSAHTAQILEHYIGPTQRLPGQRKARLFSAIRDDRPARDFSNVNAGYRCAPLDIELCGLPNVFSRDKLDIGTGFLLEHLHRVAPAETVVDLACGNGILGLVAVKQRVARKLVFCDESAMAIASAQLNANRVFGQAIHNFHFHHGDGLEGYCGDAAQLILCNPPFHQEHTVNEFAGRRLLDQCSRHLQPGGRLLLVANRHLDYLSLLRKAFSTVEKCAGNSKFNILLARMD
jgi:23S rRNA (guanine1835-N2)-methyltransferase